MQKQKTKIILVGKAGSGKDYLRKKLESQGYSCSIPFSSRPPRAGEINGKDYFFISREEFESMIDDNLFFETVFFNDWYYGTPKSQWYNGNDVFIMTPNAISNLSPEDRATSFIIYLDIPYETRKNRLFKRSDANKEAEKRLISDDITFRDYKDWDLRITNPDF